VNIFFLHHGGSEEIKESLHVGDKASAEAWLTVWWPKMRDIEDHRP
jgi:hypothetical protein